MRNIRQEGVMVIAQVFISILSFNIRQSTEHVTLRAVMEYNCCSSSTLQLLFLGYKSPDDVAKNMVNFFELSPKEDGTPISHSSRQS